MGLSTERKVFVAVLGVAGAALIIDRGILGPSDASAAATMPVVESEAALPDMPDMAAPSASTETMAQVLMQRLDGIQSQQGQHSLSAAFSLEKFMSEPAAAQGTSEQQASDQPSGNRVLDLIIAETPTLPNLSAVMPSSKGGGGALLNGKIVRVGGQTESGFTLVEVRKRSVVLGLDGRTYTVEMPVQTRP